MLASDARQRSPSPSIESGLGRKPVRYSLPVGEPDDSEPASTADRDYRESGVVAASKSADARGAGGRPAGNCRPRPSPRHAPSVATRDRPFGAYGQAIAKDADLSAPLADSTSEALSVADPEVGRIDRPVQPVRIVVHGVTARSADPGPIGDKPPSHLPIASADAWWLHLADRTFVLRGGVFEELVASLWLHAEDTSYRPSEVDGVLTNPAAAMPLEVERALLDPLDAQRVRWRDEREHASENNPCRSDTSPRHASDTTAIVRFSKRSASSERRRDPRQPRLLLPANL